VVPNSFFENEDEYLSILKWLSLELKKLLTSQLKITQSLLEDLEHRL
jgi:hypothetical protein